MDTTNITAGWWLAARDAETDTWLILAQEGDPPLTRTADDVLPVVARGLTVADAEYICREHNRLMASERQKALFLSAFELDESTIGQIDYLIHYHILPIQHKTTAELRAEIEASDRDPMDKAWLLSFLQPDTPRERYFFVLDMLIRLTGVAHNVVTTDEFESWDDLHYDLLEVSNAAKALIKQYTES